MYFRLLSNITYVEVTDEVSIEPMPVIEENNQAYKIVMIIFVVGFCLLLSANAVIAFIVYPKWKAVPSYDLDRFSGTIARQNYINNQKMILDQDKKQERTISFNENAEVIAGEEDATSL